MANGNTIRELLSDIEAQRNTIHTQMTSPIGGDSENSGWGLSVDNNINSIATAIKGIKGFNEGTIDVDLGDDFTMAAGYYSGFRIKSTGSTGEYKLYGYPENPDGTDEPNSNDPGYILTEEDLINGKVFSEPDGYYGLSYVKLAPQPEKYTNYKKTDITPSDVVAGVKYIDSDGNIKNDGTIINQDPINTAIHMWTPSVTIPAGNYTEDSTVYVTVSGEKQVTPDKKGTTVTADPGKILGLVKVLPIPTQFYDTSENSDNQAVSTDILAGKTAYTASGQITGSMTNHGDISGNAAYNSENNAMEYSLTSGYVNSLHVSVPLENKTISFSEGNTPTSITASNGKAIRTVTVETNKPVTHTLNDQTTSVDIPVGIYKEKGNVSVDLTYITNALKAI